MSVSKKKEKMIMVLEKYSFDLRNRNNMYKHYYGSDIPEKIQKKLIKYFDSHLPINSIISFFDETVGGIIFTIDGFYYKFFIEKAVFIAYSDIRSVNVEKNDMTIYMNKGDISEYTVYTTLDIDILKKVITEMIAINTEFPTTSNNSSGKVKKINLPKDMLDKCNLIIHSFSATCGGVGTGLAQIPASDNAVIVPIQVGMITSLGKVFNLNITESMAKSLIASAGATIAGRTISQFLVGWIPGIGNAINTATAAGITEAIGWLAVKNFYDRWVQDLNKGRFEGMKDGYIEASCEYEDKLRNQSNEFSKQVKKFESEKEEYENILDDYEKELENQASKYESIKEEYSNTLDAYEKELENQTSKYESIKEEYSNTLDAYEKEQENQASKYESKAEEYNDILHDYKNGLVDQEKELELKRWAAVFLSQNMIFFDQIDKYSNLIDEYYEYIMQLKQENASKQEIDSARNTYHKLRLLAKTVGMN